MGKGLNRLKGVVRTLIRAIAVQKMPCEPQDQNCYDDTIECKARKKKKKSKKRTNKLKNNRLRKRCTATPERPRDALQEPKDVKPLELTKDKLQHNEKINPQCVIYDIQNRANSDKHASRGVLPKPQIISCTDSFRKPEETVKADPLKLEKLMVQVEDFGFSTEEDGLTTVEEVVDETAEQGKNEKKVKKFEEDDNPYAEIREMLDVTELPLAMWQGAVEISVYTGKTRPVYPKYPSIESRMRTFIGYFSSVVTCTDLANGGFVNYVKNTDEVVCPECCLRLRNFKNHVDALAIHQTHSFNSGCAFLTENAKHSG